MKEEVERIKRLVGIDHNRWEQPCTCDKCKNMCKVPCIGTPKDIEAIIDAGYADRLKETMWMVGYLAVKEKPIAMIQPTEKDGWCAFRQPDGLCELHDRGLKPTEEDVRFGFEKALNQRGISASLMFECVMMWNYILEEGLEDWDEDDYRFYGLPLFKATAVKYGWDNPIGEDSGRERKYDSQY